SANLRCKVIVDVRSSALARWVWVLPAQLGHQLRADDQVVDFALNVLGLNRRATARITDAVQQRDWTESLWCPEVFRVLRSFEEHLAEDPGTLRRLLQGAPFRRVE